MDKEDTKTSDSLGGVKVSTPGPFNFIPNEWAKYKTRFERFMSLAGYDKKADQDKINCLIYCMGEKAEDIIVQFGAEENYGNLMKKFDDFFAPKRNVIYERFKFNARVQLHGERFDDFVTEVHKLAEHCDYGVIKSDLIRDRIVVGMEDKNQSDRMLLKPNLTLEEAIQMGKQAEIQSEETKKMRAASAATTEIMKIDKRKPTGNCWFCGKERHPREKCPAAKAVCHKCQRMGHFAKMCRAKMVKMINDEAKDCEVCMVHSGKYMVNVSIFHSDKFVDKVDFLIDTGADISAIPQHVAVKAKLPLVKSVDCIKGPDGTRLQVLGTVQLKLQYKDRISEGKVYVIKDLSSAILGRPSIDSMDILKVCAISISCQNSESCSNVLVEEEFPSIFNELGVFKDKFHIKLVSNPKPYVQATPRSVSIPLLPKVKEELDRLQRLGIISQIEEPTDFVSPIVVVFRNDKLRICGDYTQVNKNILRPVFPIPKVQNTLSRLKGAKYFSKIDATSGFHQICLDEESRKLTTIITPFGRYIYNRLPFGLNCAPEYFSMKFSNLFSDLNVAIHMDDILIFQPSKESHDQMLREVLKRLHNEGITINKSKCVFGVKEVCYLGHIINQEGVKVDPDRITAISEFKSPSNKKELLQFLGMVNFVGRYIPNKSHILAPLHELLKEDRMFIWGHPQIQAFQSIKDNLQIAPTLAHFDPSLNIIVSADSSSFGLGAVLLQEDKKGQKSVVMYASRTLTEAEKHYAQIEKECLALTWAAEKFRDYIIGIPVTIETDHKPLLQILHTKQFDDLSPRLLRLRLKLTRFDYKVKYIPGKELVVADALSRRPLPLSPSTNSGNDLQFNLNALINETVPDDMLNKIMTEQRCCNICNQLKQFTAHGWPAKHLLGILQPYYQYRDNFSVEGDLLLLNSRIVIPEKMHKEILNKIHEGHLGISRCRERAKQSVWWLGLSKQIEEKVKTCSKCIETSQNHKETMVLDPPPDRPWQKIGIDLFKYLNHWYLVAMDYYSRYLEVFKLHDLTEDSVIIKCKEMFSRYGIPEVVRSDCGTQFKTKFNYFAKEYGFKSITSSPYYAQSNGLAESAVKIAKNLLTKNEDIYLALLVYRNTPSETGYSPAELMFNRKLRDNLPIIPSKLNNPVVLSQELKQKHLLKKHKEISYYNRRHRAIDLPELEVNDRVWLTDLKIYGTIMFKCKEPRSYMVKTERGNFRRNRWHLKLAPNTNILPAEGRYVSNDDVISWEDYCKAPTALSDPIEGNSTELEERCHSNVSSPEGIRSESNSVARPRRFVSRPKHLDDYVCE